MKMHSIKGVNITKRWIRTSAINTFPVAARSNADTDIYTPTEPAHAEMRRGNCSRNNIAAAVCCVYVQFTFLPLFGRLSPYFLIKAAHVRLPGAHWAKIISELMGECGHRIAEIYTIARARATHHSHGAKYFYFSIERLQNVTGWLCGCSIRLCL